MMMHGGCGLGVLPFSPAVHSAMPAMLVQIFRYLESLRIISEVLLSSMSQFLAIALPGGVRVAALRVTLRGGSAITFTGPELREGLAAFREKRKPDFPPDCPL